MASIIQIDVKKAASLIQVTERTILNLIKLRKFEAIKVGKEWFIDYPSFVSFLQKYKYQKNEAVTESESVALTDDPKKHLEAILNRLNEKVGAYPPPPPPQ